MCRCAVFVVGGGFRVEIALTEHRAAAGFDGRRIQGPTGLRRVSGVQRKKREYERYTPSFVHASYLLGGKLCASASDFAMYLPGADRGKSSRSPFKIHRSLRQNLQLSRIDRKSTR